MCVYNFLFLFIRYFFVLIFLFLFVCLLTGLLKGSVTAERPRTLRRLRNVYGPTGACVMGTGGDASGERLDDANVDNTFRDRDRDEKSLSIMSPFDEQEEWAKISEIMASFGTGLVRESVFVNELEKEFQSRLGIFIFYKYYTRTDKYIFFYPSMNNKFLTCSYRI